MSRFAVRQSFNRAATSYEASAQLQQQVADWLIRAIQASLPQGFHGRILDAGSGTGYCLCQLHRLAPDALLVGIDFAEGMLRQNIRLSHALPINGDLQRLPLDDASIDLYLSSLAWQWCDIHLALNEAIRVLKPGANLWLSTLIAGTFHEMATAFIHAELSPAAHLLATPQEAAVVGAFEHPALNIRHVHSNPVTTWHRDFNALRRSIRGVGANRLPTPRLSIDRTARVRLIEAYEALRTPRGLPLTYNVLTIHAQRV